MTINMRHVVKRVLPSHTLPCRPVVSVVVLMPMELLNNMLKLLTMNVVKIGLVEGGETLSIVIINLLLYQQNPLNLILL
jgi:hypothetical protein